jgi:hypothetical protein
LCTYLIPGLIDVPPEPQASQLWDGSSVFETETYERMRSTFWSLEPETDGDRVSAQKQHLAPIFLQQEGAAALLRGLLKEAQRKHEIPSPLIDVNGDRIVDEHAAPYRRMTCGGKPRL